MGVRAAGDRRRGLGLEERVRDRVEQWAAEHSDSDGIDTAATESDRGSDIERTVEAAQRTAAELAERAGELEQTQALDQTQADDPGARSDARQDDAGDSGDHGAIERGEVRRWVAEQAESVREAIAEDGDVAGAVENVMGELREFVPEAVRASERAGVSEDDLQQVIGTALDTARAAVDAADAGQADEQADAGQEQNDQTGQADSEAVWAALLEASGAQDATATDRLAACRGLAAFRGELGPELAGPPGGGAVAVQLVGRRA